jgi:hypothetical protein
MSQKKQKLVHFVKIRERIVNGQTVKDRIPGVEIEERFELLKKSGAFKGFEIEVLKTPEKVERLGRKFNAKQEPEKVKEPQKGQDLDKKEPENETGNDANDPEEDKGHSKKAEKKTKVKNKFN